MARINPFKPTAGMNPPELIGRDEILDDFTEALENGPGAPDRQLRVSGVRGVGKTVLLNALGDVARKRGFQVVDVVANAGFCDRILGALSREREISGLSIAPSILGVSLGSVEISKSATRLGEAMFEASRMGGLFITLDEIQDAHSVRCASSATRSSCWFDRAQMWPLRLPGFPLRLTVSSSMKR